MIQNIKSCSWRSKKLFRIPIYVYISTNSVLFLPWATKVNKRGNVPSCESAFEITAQCLKEGSRYYSSKSFTKGFYPLRILAILYKIKCFLT